MKSVTKLSSDGNAINLTRSKRVRALLFFFRMTVIVVPPIQWHGPDVLIQNYTDVSLIDYL